MELSLPFAVQVYSREEVRLRNPLRDRPGMEDVLILNTKKVSTAGGGEVPGVKSEERMCNVRRGKWGGSHDDAAGILLSIVGSLGCQLWIRE